MPDSEQDRWRELADLLGLPRDEPNQAATPPAPPPQREAVTRRESPPPMPEPESRSEAPAEPPMFEEVFIAEMNIDEQMVPEPESLEREPATELAEEPSEDRPRRGRRRGRRGSRNDRPEREGQAPTERPRENSDEGFPVRAEAQPRRSEEPHHGPDDDMPHDEQLLERDDQPDTIEPAVDQEDDEEIDHLKDWDVPSWTDLIGSLYRPER